MGMFDTVYITCPHCEKLHSEQPKAGDPGFNHYNLGYNLGDDPTQDLYMCDIYECENCKESFEVVLVEPPKIEVRKL